MQQDKKEPKDAPPCACILFPVMDLGDGVLFYCDYYPESCDDPPEAAYAVEDDSTPWPYQTCGCPLCIDAGGDRKNKRKFLGLPSVVDPDYLHDGLVPAGKARALTTILVDPRLEYVQFPIGGKTIAAKVLVFSWKTGQATDGNPKNLATRLRYIAFQVSKVPAGAQRKTVTAAPIFSEEDPCYAYQSIYQPKGDKATPVMVLLAK